MSVFISVINQLDAQNFCFTVSLFHASTCFEHTCSSSGCRNCITQPLVSSHLQVWWYLRLCNAILTSWSLEHMLETYCKTKILCIKLVNYWDARSAKRQKKVPIVVYIRCTSWWKTINTPETCRGWLTKYTEDQQCIKLVFLTRIYRDARWTTHKKLLCSQPQGNVRTVTLKYINVTVSS